MDAKAWRAQRDREIDAKVGPQASRVEAWPIWKRAALGGGIMLAASSGGIVLVLLLAVRADRAGAVVVGAFLGVVLLTTLVAFMVAPRALLRFLARSGTSSTDPAESAPWNVPG